MGTELRRSERIIGDEYGGEELVFITDPLHAGRLFLTVVLTLTQFLHIAAYQHVLQLGIALFELTSLFLLRNTLSPLEFQRIDILRQFGLHVMRFERQMHHIVIR